MVTIIPALDWGAGTGHYLDSNLYRAVSQSVVVAFYTPKLTSMSNKEKLEQLNKLMDEYLMLPSKGVVKLLCSFGIACFLPTQSPWLFIVGGPSTGKTELIKLLEGLPGFFPIDNLSGNALLSGMKRSDTSASLLHRTPKEGGFLVFSDFTTMLAKRQEDLSDILGQLRVVFDGRATKHTGGQEETVQWEGKLGLLAGCTTSLYYKTEDYAEVGQRMIIYHMEQPDNRLVGKFKFRKIKTDRKALTKQIQDLVADIVATTKIPTSMSELPDFDEQTENDLIDIADLAVTARSPINRNKYSREKTQESKEDKEGIGRVLGQLMNVAHSLMVLNEDMKLYPEDRKILYQIGLDCIDPRKRVILQALTQYSYGGDVDAITNTTLYEKEITQRMLGDLFSLGMIDQQKNYYGGMNKVIYTLKPHYKEIMSRFEGIEIEDKKLEDPTIDLNDPFENLGPAPAPETPVVEETELF